MPTFINELFAIWYRDAITIYWIELVVGRFIFNCNVRQSVDILAEVYELGEWFSVVWAVVNSWHVRLAEDARPQKTKLERRKESTFLLKIISSRA